MLSTSAFLASLPPASLAAADLARFATRVLNRRGEADLAPMLALLEGHALSGYPPALATALRVIIGEVQRLDIAPERLDPTEVERILSRRESLQALADADRLERQPLRPGVPVSDELRELTGDRLRMLRGVGPQLVLVAPVEAASLPGLGWSTLRGPALARLMDTREAEALRHTWAEIEECYGWRTDAVLPWEAELVRIAARPNHDAAGIRETLEGVSLDARRSLWSTLIEHVRELELDEAHRPTRKALVARVAETGPQLEDNQLTPLLALAQSAYEACAVDALVEHGLCPTTERDLELYAARVDLPDATRQRLKDYQPALVEHRLRTLAEIDNAGLDVPFDEQQRRDLRGLRDVVLRRRHRRDISALLGVDPLLLAEYRCSIGADRDTIIAALESLRKRAREAFRRDRGKASGAEPETSGDAPQDEVEAAASDPDFREDEPQRLDEDEPQPSGEVGEPEPVEEGQGAEPLDAVRPSRWGDGPAAAPRNKPITELELPKMDLPPLPKPPPFKSPITKTGMARPSLPMPPVVRSQPSPLPPEPVATPRKRPATVPSQAGAPSAAPIGTLDFSDLPIPPRTRRPTTSRLVTPAQAGKFYEEAFRELQVLERDLLERGPWQEAAERLHVLAREAEELRDALGPSARSGDRDSRAAIGKITIVENYLARVRPLLDGPPPSAEEAPPPEEEGGVFRKLGGFLRKGRRKHPDAE